MVPVPDDVTEKLLAVLGNRAKPLHNCFDSDAAYNYETGQYIIFLFFSWVMAIIRDRPQCRTLLCNETVVMFSAPRLYRLFR